MNPFLGSVKNIKKKKIFYMYLENFY